MTLQELYFLAKVKDSFREFENSIACKLFNKSETQVIDCEIEIAFDIKMKGYTTIHEDNKDEITMAVVRNSTMKLKDDQQILTINEYQLANLVAEIENIKQTI